MLQREDFRARLEKQEPIHAHEIQYPIMQGWDSVMVKADVELGGTDQLFNILVGRDFQREQGLPQQVVLLLPILEGLDGEKKMSKSLGNHIGVNEPPNEMFGKLMSISDEMMARLLRAPARPRIAGGHASPGSEKAAGPRNHCDLSHGGDRTKNAGKIGTQRFSEKRLAEANLPEFVVAENLDDAIPVVVAAYWKSFGITKSRTDVRRLIEQGSVQLDGEKITDPKSQLSLHSRSGFAIRQNARSPDCVSSVQQKSAKSMNFALFAEF